MSQTKAQLIDPVDGTIVNADINASAAIAGSKISPSFTSDITITDVNPALLLVDSNNNSDYELGNQDGTFRLRDSTNTANRMTLSSSGQFDFEGNVDCNAGLDVTGSLAVSGSTDGVLNVDTSDSRGAFIRFGQGGSFHNMVGCADGLTSGDKEDLGVRAADNIIFASGGSTERMRLDSSGRVGIGTTSPDTPLTVSRATTGSVIRGLSTNNNTRAQLDLTGKDSSGNAVTMKVGGDGDFGGMLFTFTNHKLGFATNNAAPQMTLDTSGNLGIATISAGGKLAILSNSSTYEGLELQTPASDANGEFHIGVHDKGASSGRSIVFKRGGADGMDTESLRITSGGIIQIGGALSNGTGDLDTVNSKLSIKQSANNQEDGIYIERSGERRGFYAYVGGPLSQSDAFGIASQQLGTKTDVLAIDRGGDVAIGAGDLFFTTAGKGIVLGATSNTHNNTLSDYETGTYTITATLGSGSISSYTSRTGSYVKIGSVVHVVGRLHVNVSTSNVTSFSFSLPFANESGAERDTSCVCHVIRANGGDPVQGLRIFRIQPDYSTAVMNNHEGQVIGDLGGTQPHININFTYNCVL